MEEMQLWIIGTVLKGTGAVFGLLAGGFAFFAVAQNEKHEATQAWFEERWESVRASRWLTLPERVIEAVLRAKAWVGPWVLEVFKTHQAAVLNSTLVSCLVGVWIAFGWAWATIMLLLVIISVVLSIVIPRIYPWIASPVFFGALSIGATLSWTVIALGAPSALAPIAMLAAIPTFFIVFAWPLVFLRKVVGPAVGGGAWMTGGFAFGLSFVVTLAALLLGTLVQPTAADPRSLQLLISNVIFDGVTMLFTFWILAWAVANPERTWLRIPAALAIDLAVAGFCACASLYLGLLFSAEALSIGGVGRVLVGLAPEGGGAELGPWFWAMHTTFLPTLAYLALILVAWFGKTMLLPLRWFLSVGHENPNPLALTAALFTLVAGAFTLSGFGVEAFGEWLKRAAELIGT